MQRGLSAHSTAWRRAARGGTQSPRGRHDASYRLRIALTVVVLPVLGAAGQHHDPAGQRRAYGLPLRRRVRKALRHFPARGYPHPASAGPRWGTSELAEPRGNVLLGGEQVGR